MILKVLDWVLFSLLFLPHFRSRPGFLFSFSFAHQYVTGTGFSVGSLNVGFVTSI